MSILLFASHLLHWRALIPVAVELAHRGHSITVQINRPNWMGMPAFQMNWRPTQVTGVNRASLAWLADRIGWREAQGGIECERWLVPEEYDCAVSTTKDLDRLRNLGKEINGYMTTYAVGYQHFPGLIQVGRYDWADRLLKEQPPPPMPTVFTGIHPFGAAHGFGKLAQAGRVTPCGFPHLDKIETSQSHKRNAVLIQHHGGYRGITGHGWLVGAVSHVVAAGYHAYICPHFIPGAGYGEDAIRHVLSLAQLYGWEIVARWWDVAGHCDLILTTGSSAAYEMWSVGLTNVFILGYVGGKRHEKFTLFKDLVVESPTKLVELLGGLPGSDQATEPLTREVMKAYRSVHTGQGAKTAADVIEGKT